MRVRSPSTTLTLTRTVSPGAKSGISLPAESLAICSCSSSLIRCMGILRRQRRGRRAVHSIYTGWAPLYDTRCGLSSFWSQFQALAGRISGPKIGAPFARQAFGFRPPPSCDLAVIPREEDIRDGLALPGRRPRIMRVFQQSFGEAFVGG